MTVAPDADREDLTGKIGPDAYQPSPNEVQAIIERRLTGAPPMREQVAVTRRLFEQVITAAWTLSIRGQHVTAAAVHSELPPPRAKRAFTPTVAQVASILESEMGRRALADRGLSLHGEEEMTYEMVATIRALMDPRPLSHAQRLRIAGVTQSQYEGFLTYPRFRQTLQEGTEVALKGGIAEANAALVRNVQKGDLKAIQYLHTLTGYYDPNKQTAMDMAQLLQEVQTIVFKRVTDPQALMSIAGELGLLLRRLEVQDELNHQALPAGGMADMAGDLAALQEIQNQLGPTPDWTPPAEALAGLDTPDDERETPSTME